MAEDDSTLRRHSGCDRVHLLVTWTKWGESSTGRRVKFYSITRRGEQQLHTKEVDWQRAAGIVMKFFKLSKELK
jgi:hypothetical protein